MLVGALAGIAVFEANSGVLMGGIRAKQYHREYFIYIADSCRFLWRLVCRARGKTFYNLMWHSMLICLLAGFYDVGTRLVWDYEYMDIVSPSSGIFFGAGMLFH